MAGPINGLLGFGPMPGPPGPAPLVPGLEPRQPTLVPGLNPPQGIPMPSQQPTLVPGLGPPQQGGGLLGAPIPGLNPPPDQEATADPMTKLRYDYEDKLAKLPETEKAYRDHWLDYMNKAKKIDPGLVLYPDQWKIHFPDKYPEYATPK